MIKKFTQVLTLLGILIFIEFQNLYPETRLYLHKKHTTDIWTITYDLIDDDELQITTIDTKEYLVIPTNRIKILKITNPNGLYAIFSAGEEAPFLPLEEACYECTFSPDEKMACLVKIEQRGMPYNDAKIHMMWTTVINKNSLKKTESDDTLYGESISDDDSWSEKIERETHNFKQRVFINIKENPASIIAINFFNAFRGT